MMNHCDLVSTIMFHLHIVIMNNKSVTIKIKYSFDVCTS